MDKDTVGPYRSFLKDSIRKMIDFSQTDQNRGIAPPPIEKPYAKEGKRIDLFKWDEWGDIGQIDLKTAKAADPTAQSPSR